MNKNACSTIDLSARRSAQMGIKMKVKEKLNQYLINLVILLLTWGGLYRGGFNNDTVLHMVSQKADITVRLECGRFLDAFFDWILYRMGLSTTTDTGASVIAGLLFLAAALCIVQQIFAPRVKTDTLFEKIGFYAVTALLFVNGLFSEYLMFSELAVWFGVSYFVATLGIRFFTQKKYIRALILFFLSTHFYQVAVVYAAILLSIWIFMENDGHITLKTVREELLCGVLTFGSGLLNILSVDLAVQLGVIKRITKGVSYGVTGTKLKECLANFVMLLRNGKGLLPGMWLPLLILLFGCGVTLYYLFRKKDKGAVFYYLLLVPAVICMIYVIPMAQTVVYLPPRIVAPFYTVQSMLLLLAFACASGWVREAACYVCCGYLVIQMIFGNVIVANRYVSNTLDKIYINMVYEKIVEYEEETGTEVKKFAVTTDAYSPFHYDEVYYKTDQINEKIMGTATNSLMQAQTGRIFEKVPMDEKMYEKYFEGKDWKYFDASEQLVIDGDTAYLAVF